MRRISFAHKKRSDEFALKEQRRASFDGVISRRKRRLMKVSFTRNIRSFCASSFFVVRKVLAIFHTFIVRKKSVVIRDVVFCEKRKVSFQKGLLRKITNKRKEKTHYFRSLIQVVSGNLRAQVSFFLIVAIVGSMYFLPFGAKSATFTFTQNDWSGGATVNTANHTSNKTGWNEYENQNGLVVGTDVKLPTTDYTFTDDGTTIPQNIASGGGFTNGTFSNTVVQGVGSGSSILLSNGVNSGEDVIKTFTVPGEHTFVPEVTNNNVAYLVVAGGGGSGNGGGGGAGGFLTGTTSFIGSMPYTIVVGSGGAPFTQGGNSSAFGQIAIGGGGGGPFSGGSGGSGGGGAYNNDPTYGGAGTPGQGNAGGGNDNCDSQYPTGGGGGAGGPGGSASWNGGCEVAGNGGVGRMSSISGTATYYAGGGGGATGQNGFPGLGGLGGGGNGGNMVKGTAGSPNTGGGGGGSGWSDSGTYGGSGIVIVRYLLPTYYESSGLFTSAPIDLGSVLSFGNFSWAETLNGGTVTMEVRSSNLPDFSTASAWGTCTITNGSSLLMNSCVTSGDRYIQYQATLSTTDILKTPRINDVTIGYSQYGSGDLTSSVYNTESFANLIAKMSWTSTDTSADDTIKFQIRSADTAGGIASAVWCGYSDCSGSSYFDQSQNGVTLLAGHPLLSGGDDQYFQYKVFLQSKGVVSPVLTGSMVEYVVNAVPELDPSFDTNGISVSQISNSSDPDWGKVHIIYKVRDIDTSDGTNTPGYITPSFSYDNGSGFVLIDSAHLSSGSLSNKSVGNVAYTQYDVIWDAKADIANTYSTNLQVKVTINDNEAANNTASVIDTITFDSKTPVLGTYPLLVDASLSPASMTLSASDDSSLQMKVGLASDLSDAVYETYNATKLLSLVTNPDVVYVQYRDVYNNETSISSATSSETPTMMIVQDVSNSATSEWRLFTSWKTVASPVNGFANYQLYRSTDNVNFSLLTTISSRTTNYYIDDTALFDTIYYYKIKTTDAIGNVSWFSSVLQGKANGIQDAGEGGGGTETTPPIISNVLSGSVSTTQATITWNTNELSTSTVGFSVNSGFFVDEIGVATYADNASGSGIHQVVLSGLTPATTYYYQVKSSDPSGNEAIDNNGGGGYSFTTHPGPAISGVALSSASNTQATIVWNTDINATTIVSYSPDVSGGSLVAPVEVGTSDMVKSHSQMITGLNAGTTYHFFVKSVDIDGNIALDNNAGAFYMFTTTSDTTPPVISTLSASVLTFDRAALTWITDEPSTSQIKYATRSGGPYTATTETVTYGQDHFVVITALLPDTTYYFKAYSTDLSGNQSISPENSFTTLQDPSFQHSPLSSITDVVTSLVTDTNAVITLTTDQPAMCSIEYGTIPGNYTATPVTEVLENKKHSITLTSLLFLTTYYYQATCIDNLDTTIVAPEGSFTTKALQVDSGSEGGDITAPNVSSVSVSAITGENATVTWTTDELANGYVSYGITADYGAMEGDYVINQTTSAYTTDHTILLKNLVPSTKYYFVVLSSDARGNITTSSESSFTTSSPSTISSINIVSNKIGEVSLAWKTSTLMSSLVEYGLTETYGDKQESTTQKKEHSMTITKLTSNELYHFRVKGKDKDNNLFSSSDYTFSPRSLPKISNVSSKVISDTEVEVSFNTSVPTDANISFVNVKDGKDTGTQGKPDLALAHIVSLKNLQPGASYSGKIVASDEAGNKVTQDVSSFTTSQDTTPPEIDQLKADMALSQDGKVQSIISWYTNEPTTTMITYKEGTGGEEKTLAIKEGYSTAHIAVITTFKVGSVYFLKAHSTDKSGNETVSKERMILTPQLSENVIQMIIGNFKDIFSWAKI